MARQKAILVISGILVVAGILISFMQSETEMSGIATSQQTVPAGGSMNVSKALDPSVSTHAVYSIQVTDFKQGQTLSASVIDPYGSSVLTRTVSKSPYQENFTVYSAGLYNLKIENNAQADLQVNGIIGYYPQAASLLDFASVAILIAGLSGLAVGMMYLIKSRTRPGPSS
ncbi:MAG TPA: hypothetical protein VJ792_06855 [Candidatus Nitrosotalea sp.]|nr:hypothetical protein [Candidatus Nitrosotalea sp.]